MTDNVAMPDRLSIGEFSRMTHLSVKALRHYHDQGLLAPAEIDRWSSYRYYRSEQVVTAQVIRRFRDLGMPIDELKALLRASDVESRNEVIVAHLDRMRAQLEETQSTVEALRTLLDPTGSPVPVEYRTLPPTPALTIVETVTAEEALGWWMDAFDELYATAAQLGCRPAGPGGALFPGEFYELEKAEITAYVPLEHTVEGGSSRATPDVVPAAELAIALHQGPFSDIDLTYGQLGRHVAAAAIGVDGPIREHYLVTVRDTPEESAHRVEVGWPVFRTTLQGPATTTSAGST